MYDSKKETLPLQPNSDLFELGEREEKKLSKALYDFNPEIIKEIVAQHNISAYKKNDANILIHLLTGLTENLYDRIIRETFSKSQAFEELRKEVSAIPHKLLSKLIPFLDNKYQFINLIASDRIEEVLNKALITHKQEISPKIRETLSNFIHFCRHQYETNITLVSQIIEIAIKQGVPINAFCSSGFFARNPITVLFTNGHIDMTLLRCLLSNNADLLAKDPTSGITVLETSTYYSGAFDMLNLFLEMGLEINKIPEKDYDSVRAALIRNFREHNDDTRKAYEELVTRRGSRKPSSLFWLCAKKLASFDQKQVAANLEYKQVKRLNQEPSSGSITPSTLGIVIDSIDQNKLTVYWLDGHGKLNHEVSVAHEIAEMIPKEADEVSNDTLLIKKICAKFGCSKKIPEEMERAIEDARPLKIFG